MLNSDSESEKASQLKDPLKLYLTQPYSLFKLIKKCKNEAYLVVCSDNMAYYKALKKGKVSTSKAPLTFTVDHPARS